MPPRPVTSTPSGSASRPAHAPDAAPHRDAPPPSRRAPFRVPLRTRLRRTLLRLRARLPSLPALAPLEKTALVVLTLVLSAGAGLRLWERSGIVIGPVRDWDTLRELVLQARLGLPEGETFPCLDAAPSDRFVRTEGAQETAEGGTREGVGTESAILTAGAPAKTASKASGGAGKALPPRPLNLNRASADALEALPGIGPSTARAIVAERAAGGAFRSVDDLLRVKGIGPKKLDALRPHVFVPAPREDTAAWPGDSVP